MSDFCENKLARLRDLAAEVIVSGRPRSSLRGEVLSLKSILSEAGLYRFDPEADISFGETRTTSGVAVSPTMAAMCLDDYARTTEFLRGVFAAITTAKRVISDRPVHILYAGCGPFAALAVPVMAVLKPEDAAFTLIDIHPESIESARAVVDSFGFSDRVKAFEIADAADYKIDAGNAPDIILSETLRATLKAEPQVAITRNLVTQAPNAVLIPEEIRVELKLVDLSREFDFNGAGVERDRIYVGDVFVLNREVVAAWQEIDTGFLEGSTLRLPASFGSEYVARLFTMIRVFGDHKLEDYMSGLTYPRRFIKDEVEPGDEIRFWYKLGPDPGLEFEVNPCSGDVIMPLPD